MDWKEIEFIIKEQTEVFFLLSRQLVQILADPQKMTPIVQSLEDGSIDPGDFEDISSRLLEFIKSMDSFQNLLKFTKTNRAPLGKLYQFLGQTNDEDFDRYIELTQKVATDLSVEKMLDQLKSMNIVIDKR